MSAVKIGVVGAGSAVFSLGLVRDLCLQESLAGSAVTFMDVDSQRLRMIHRLGQRYAAELGADLRFAATPEREVAFTALCWAWRETSNGCAPTPG